MEEHAQADKHPQVEIERHKKRERRFQLQVERLNEFLQDREPKRGSDGKEIQSNAVDNESVKMPCSHGVVQGYNAQALVDSKHQVILAAEAFASQDHENLQPMLERAQKNAVAIGKDETYFQGKQLTADPNYHSRNSLKVCKDEKIDAYIPTSNTAHAIRTSPIKSVSRMAFTAGSAQTPSQGSLRQLTSLSIQTNGCIVVPTEKN